MRLPTEGVTSAPARGLVASRHAEPTATATVTTVKSLDPLIRTMRGPRCERSTEAEAQVLDPRWAGRTRGGVPRARYITRRATPRETAMRRTTFHIETVASAPSRRSVSPRP